MCVFRAAKESLVRPVLPALADFPVRLERTALTVCPAILVLAVALDLQVVPALRVFLVPKVHPAIKVKRVPVDCQVII